MSFSAQIFSRRRIRRRHFLGLVALLTLLFWGLLWGAAALRFNAQVNGWIARESERGGTLDFSSRALGGTPWTVHIYLDDFHLRADAYEASADRAILRLSLWDWGHASVKLKGKTQGRIEGFNFAADVFKFGFMWPVEPPINETETGLYVWVKAFGLTPTSANDEDKPQPFALGETIESFAFNARVMGTPPDFSNTQKVRDWSEAGGVVEFDDLSLRWGRMNLVAKGTMALTAELQPEGAFSGRIEGLEAAVDDLLAQGALPRKQETLLRSSLAVLARPSGVVGASTPIVPLSLQNGSLFLGPVRIAALPPLTWP